ncbi:TIGR01440 family protein [Rubeoparvulum massiliense]|uniref:TIGR01440 family protein n=1 Tax=Rubeoparvulum massiliense TaxID=1631346 RepID=UPI00065E026B|nr:TIGR01440 family protein [Rubeoparvulum massiliense]
MDEVFFNQIATSVNQAVTEFMQQAPLTKGQVFVVGCSTSEVMGNRIGSGWSNEVAQVIYQELQKLQQEKGFDLAFQCCEHLNRALVVERHVAIEHNLELVSAIPIPGAGGSMAAAAYRQMEDPVLVETILADAGMDIGDTLIGMHLRRVAVPVRINVKEIGAAHVTMAKTRPKLIGGTRAVYTREEANKKIEGDHHGTCR